MKMTNLSNGEQERVVYIEYRKKVPCRAITIDMRGHLSTWVFVSENGALSYYGIQEPGGDHIRSLQHPLPGIKKEDMASYWMEKDADFLRGGKMPFVPRNMERIPNPHYLKNADKKVTRNPFNAAIFSDTSIF